MPPMTVVSPSPAGALRRFACSARGVTSVATAHAMAMPTTLFAGAVAIATSRYRADLDVRSRSSAPPRRWAGEAAPYMELPVND